jgi:hypothetical protein
MVEIVFLNKRLQENNKLFLLQLLVLSPVKISNLSDHAVIYLTFGYILE